MIRFLVALAVLAPAAAWAQAPSQADDLSSLTGVVLDEAGRRPVEGVTVRLEPAGAATVTDEDGRYTLRGVPPAVYTVSFELIGRAERTDTVTLSPGASERLEVRLSTSAILLDRVQVTATRSRRATTEVAAPVSILDRGTIERVQARKVGDLFALEPGVEVSGSGPFEGLPVIRGLSGNRVLVLVDGQRLNNSREAINFGGVQPSLVDIERVEEVEIVRGPASVLYGTDALGGIVNIVTTHPPFPAEGFEWGGSVRSGYRTVDNGRNVAGDVHVAGSRLGLRLAGAWREAEDFDSPRGEVVNSGARSVDLNAELEAVIAPEHHLILEVQHFEADDVGVPGSSGTFTGSFPFTDRDKVALEYRAEGLPAVGSLTAEAYFQDQEENFATVLDLPPISAGPFELLIDTETERISDVETLGFGFQAETVVGQRHHFTYGVDFFRDDVDERRREETVTLSQPVSPGPPPMTETTVDSVPTTPKSTFQGWGVFFQDEIDVGRLSLTPGIRFDRFDINTQRLERPEGTLAAEDRTEEAVSASLSVLLRATDHVRPTLTIGRAFRTPNIIERFFFGPGSQGGLSVPNPALDNETSLNLDVGAKLSFPVFRASVTYFHNRVDNFITFRPGTFQGDSTFAGQPISQVQNVGEVRLQGIEASAEYLLTTPTLRWLVFGSFSYTDGKDLEADEPLFVPPAKGVLGIQWSDVLERASLTLTGRAVGRQDDVPVGFDETAGFAVFDARASLDLQQWTGQDLVLRLGLANLTDKAYREPYNANLSPGRSLETSVRIGF